MNNFDLTDKSQKEMRDGLISLEIKASNDGSIEGYGSIFGNIDQGYDVIEAGAFVETLRLGRKIKMLWQHDSHSPIGIWDEVYEDGKGLRVKGHLLTELEKGREAAILLKSGAIDGLSIGYRSLQSRGEERAGEYVRVIEKVELWEVSLVTFPMNPAATIDAVKASAMSLRDFERQLLSGSKLSRTVVSALLKGGFKGVQALSGSGQSAEELELLEALNVSHLLNLISKDT